MKYFLVSEVKLDELQRWSRSLQTCSSYDGDDEYIASLAACREVEVPSWATHFVLGEEASIGLIVDKHEEIKSGNS